MDIITIQFEIGSKNIIVTKQDENGFLQVRGYSPVKVEDWDYMDENSELIAYKAFFWRDIERPLPPKEELIIDEYE